MKNLYININPELVYYPIVNFDGKTGICEISGESYMEETYKFYNPIIDWLKEYTTLNMSIALNIKLTYFNTSSSRFIIEILSLLKNYQKNGGEVTVCWFYNVNDSDMLTEINDFVEEVGIEIVIKKL